MSLLQYMDDGQPLKKGKFVRVGCEINNAVLVSNTPGGRGFKFILGFYQRFMCYSNGYLCDVDPEGLDWPCFEEFL